MSLQMQTRSLGITDRQAKLLSLYADSTQARPMSWPEDKNDGTSMRALVRRRHMFQTHNGLYIAPRGIDALSSLT